MKNVIVLGAGGNIAKHVAIAGALDGKAVEWMEKVSDEQYLAASGAE